MLDDVNNAEKKKREWKDGTIVYAELINLTSIYETPLYKRFDTSQLKIASV